MKQQQTLTLAGKRYRVLKRDIRRRLNRTARACFTVAGQAPKRGLVTYSFQINTPGGVSSQRPWFIGYIEKSQPINDTQTQVLCADLSGVLAAPLPLNLRNTTLSEVLSTVSDAIGLKLILASKSLADTKAPYFYNLGNGYQVLESLPSVFNIPNFQWQLTAQGDLQLGSAADMPWDDKRVKIPTKLLTKHQGNATAELTPMPSIRPGVYINDQQIQSVNLNNSMVMSWKI